jgi:hypothetical protein
MNNDDILLNMYDDALAALAAAREQVGKLEQEILRRADERGATGLPSDIYTCKINTTHTYDPSVLVQLKELLSTDELAQCWVMEHKEWITMPEKWDVRKLLPIARVHGDEALGIVEQAKIPERRRLEFKRK